MAVSPVKLIQERERQTFTSDFNFYRKFIFFFELRVPARLAPGTAGQFFFPLALGPEQYSMSEPFTVESTPTQGGGLYVEENGIVMRTIKLSGHTGFKPRSLGEDRSVTALSALSPEERSFGRRLRTIVLAAISGQKHFQYLQDAVFRTYADLKRDPSTAEDTKLIFHNPQDEEAWHVVPQNFSLSRSADKRVLYPYEIELLVVDKDISIDKDFSEDKSLLDSVKDGIRMVKSGLDLAAGALNDATALASELTGTIKNYNLIISGATKILDAAGEFVNNNVDHIEVPYSSLNTVTSLIDEALTLSNTLEEANEDIQRIPEYVYNKFRTIADGLDRIAGHPQVFEKWWPDELEEIRDSQDLLLNSSWDTINEAKNRTPPTTYEEVNALGTTPTPGDVQSASAELRIGQSILKFTGTLEIRIGMGDTLANLAARYLGDARLWQHIAILNGLKPPFVNSLANIDLSTEEEPFPGVLGIGNTILIPNFSKSPRELPLVPVLGVSSEELPEVHLLGTDLVLEPVVGRTGSLIYDIPIDVEGGSVGPKTVSGKPNIIQSVQLRLRTEKGSDTLYKRVGLGRVIGTNYTLTNVEAARLKFIEAIDQDSRVASVIRIDFLEGGADAFIVDSDVELRGFTESVNVQTAFTGS